MKVEKRAQADRVLKFSVWTALVTDAETSPTEYSQEIRGKQLPNKDPNRDTRAQDPNQYKSTTARPLDCGSGASK